MQTGTPRVMSATRTVLGLLCLMYFITYVDRVNIGTAAPVIAKEMLLSNTQLGYIFSAFAYPYLLFQIIGGWVGDRFGARKTLFVCGLIWALATILTGLVGGFVTLFVARLLLGFGEGATFPTATRAMQDWTPAGGKSFAQGFTHAFSRLGNFVTPPIVAWLIVLVTWHGAFVALGLVSLIWVVAWLWYFRDSPRTHPGITQAELDRLPEEKAGRAQQQIPWKRLILRISPVTFVYFCYGWSLWLLLNWLPSFFLNNYHLNLKNAAWFSSAVFLAGVVGDTAGGMVSDRLLRKTNNLNRARRDLVIVCNVAAALCLLPVLFIHDLNIDALCLAGGFFFLEFTIGPMWAIPMDIAPKYAGTASGVMNTGSALAAIVSPIVFGVIVDLTGSWVYPFIGSIGLLLVGAAFAFTMHPDRKFVEQEYEEGSLVPR